LRTVDAVVAKNPAGFALCVQPGGAAQEQQDQEL
jgi:hypothetical protein